MWRYYALATLIVAGVGSVVFAHRLATGDWDVRATPVGTPTVTRGNGETGTPSSAFTGEGPWVLSALPDCFDQQSSIVGTPLQLAFDLPPARDRLPVGTELHRGPCTVIVRDDSIFVARGADRLRVPPSARLYRTHAGLILVYERGSRAEIRVYK
jgi:hypothetical protein